MSKLVISKVEHKRYTQQCKLTGVYFAWCKLESGDTIFDAKDKPKNALVPADYEYCVDVFMDKKTAKEVKKVCPKKNIKEIDTEGFEKVYGFKAPFDGDEQFLIKFNTSKALKSDVGDHKKGDLVPHFMDSRPKVYLASGEDDNGNPLVKEITLETKVGNGSQGYLIFMNYENSYGLQNQFTGVCVEDLVPYESKDQGDNSAFGTVVSTSFKEDSQQDQSGDIPWEDDKPNLSKDSTEDGIGDGVDPFQMPDED